MQSFSLKGRNALVVGGTSGIGNAIAHGLAQAGAHVGIAGRGQPKVDAALATLRQDDPNARGYVCDATQTAAIEKLKAAVLSDFGHVDILVPAQGINVVKQTEEITEAEYDAVMNTNLRSVFFTCMAFGRHMMERGEGVIVNITSMSAHRGWPKAVPYGISKHGVLALTHSLAAEWATRGVRVNAISPGFFLTELTAKSLIPERRESALRRTPMGRFGELDELIGAAVYLASPAAKFVTGTVINVDGGYLAGGI